jgi:hypothetical protein
MPPGFCVWIGWEVGQSIEETWGHLPLWSKWQREHAVAINNWQLLVASEGLALCSWQCLVVVDPRGHIEAELLEAPELIWCECSRAVWGSDQAVQHGDLVLCVGQPVPMAVQQLQVHPENG